MIQRPISGVSDNGEQSRLSIQITVLAEYRRLLGKLARGKLVSLGDELGTRRPLIRLTV